MDELKVWKEHGIFVLFILSSLYYYALMKDYFYCFFMLVGTTCRHNVDLREIFSEGELSEREYSTLGT